MKSILIVLVLAVAPAVLAAAAVQGPERSNTPQGASDGARSASDRSTSHDRHMHKHRAASHHHRHRTTTKGYTH